MSDKDDRRYLRLDEWTFEDWFLPLPAMEQQPVIKRIEHEVEAADIGNHPFFRLACRSRPALELWVTQELVISNAFSQIVLAAASRIVN